MPNDPTWEDTSEQEPTWDETTDFTKPVSTSLAVGPVGRAGTIRYRPQNFRVEPGFTNEQLDQSLVGISPSIVPPGTTPATSALSALGKTAAGVGQFITSPRGIAETAVTTTPAAPFIMAKWAYDMARGGYRSTKAIVDELGQMANEALNRGIISANQLGPIPEGTTTQEHIQSLAENAANAVAMGLGVTALASHGLGRDKVTPATPEPVPKAPKVSITGFRHGSEEGTQGVGTFYYTAKEHVPDVFKSRVKKTELQFNNVLDEVSQKVLASKWFPNKYGSNPQEITPEMEKDIALEAVRRGYDAVTYHKGQEVQDLRNVKLPPEEAPPSVAPAGESPTAPAVSAAEVPVTAGTELATVEPTPIRTTTQEQAQRLKLLGLNDKDISDLKSGNASVSDIVARKLPGEEGRGPDHAAALEEARMQAQSDIEQALTGMGGALAKGEIPETGAGSEKYGVAERIRAERAKAGQVVPVEPGKGMTTQQTIAMGRDIVRRDPEAGPRILEAFENDPKKATSTEGRAVVRAHGESLAAGARTIEETYGTMSPQYEQAKAVIDDWDTRSKKMDTEFQKQGMAMQGETDIDTGSYTGLNRARKQLTGKDIPEPQKPIAEKIAKENKDAQEAVNVASQKLLKQIAEKFSKDPEQSKVWERAKFYLNENKGFYNFSDLRDKIATDLGMKPSEVTAALAKDKSTKKLADDVLIKQRNARRLKESAKLWLRELDTPGYIRALSSIPRAMFNLSVFGHGFVALGTHAPIVAFQPRFWNAYVRNFGKMYKMVFSPVYYESQMADLVRRPNYERARNAGLQNDPFQYEEFHTTAIRDLVKDWIGEKNMNRVDNFASAGNRGYGVLKLLRQDMFDQKYDRLPDSVRGQPALNKALANDINHATGVTAKAAPKGANIALFAPRLAGSRVMWLLGDPIKAATTVANWKNASVADRTFAVNQMREKGWVLGTFASLLAANQGLLTAAGSKQKINGIPEFMGGAGFDPLASDFMKFKALGGDIAYGGALLTMAKLPVRVATAILYDGKGSKYVLEDERVDKVIGSYIRSQASPFAGTVADLALGRDYAERPLPAKMFGTVEQTGAVPKRLQEQGVDEPYNWPEFAATKLPIPIAEGFKEGLKGAGMNDQQANYWLKAAAITTLMTATGTRITEDTREE